MTLKELIQDSPPAFDICTGRWYWRNCHKAIITVDQLKELNPEELQMLSKFYGELYLILAMD